MPETTTSYSATSEPLVDQTQPLENVIGQYVGYATGCWENLRGAGTFLSDDARRVVDELTEYVRQAIDGPGAHVEIGGERMTEAQYNAATHAFRNPPADRSLADDPGKPPF